MYSAKKNPLQRYLVEVDISYPVIFWGFFHEPLNKDPYWNKPIFQWKETRDDTTPWNLTSEGKPLKRTADCQKERMIFQPSHFLDDFSPFFWWFSIPPSKKIPSKYHQMLVSGIWIFFGDSVVIPTFTVGDAWRSNTKGSVQIQPKYRRYPVKKKLVGFWRGWKNHRKTHTMLPFFPKFMEKIEKQPKPRWFKVTCLRRVMVIFNPPPSVKKGHETWQSLRFFLRRFRSSAEAVSLLREENVYISWISWNYWVLDPRIVFDHKFAKKKSGGSLVMVLKWFWSLEVGFIFLLVANATITYTPED